MRFRQLKCLLPLTAGVLLVIATIYLGMAFLESEVVDPITASDITEELNQCFADRFPRNELTHCSIDEFSFSDSYTMLATNSQECRSVGIPPKPLASRPSIESRENQRSNFPSFI